MDNKIELDGARGVCQFCGQVIMMDKPGKDAFWSCDCSDAKREVRALEQIDKGRERVRELFGSACEDYGFRVLENADVMATLEKLVELAVRDGIGSAKIGLYGLGSAKISVNAKGVITVERSKTDTYALEV